MIFSLITRSTFCIIVGGLFFFSCSRPQLYTDTFWKPAAGNYDSTSFTPRGLFLIEGKDLYCGAREGLFLRSREGKFNRVDIPVEENVVMRSMVSHNKYLFVGFQEGGLFRSAGPSGLWKEISSKRFHSNKFWGLFENDTAVVAVIWPRFVYYSLDNGESWKDMNKGMPESGMGVMIGHSKGMLAKDGFIFASIINEGVFRWDGNKWTSVSNGLPGDRKVRSICVVGKTLFCGTEDGVYRSEDNGVNWKPSNEGMTKTMVISMLAEGNELYATSNEGKVFKSSGNGSVWALMNQGLHRNHVVYDIEKVDNIVYISADGETKVPSSLFYRRINSKIKIGE